MVIEGVIGGLAYLGLRLLNRWLYTTVSRFLCLMLAQLIVLGNAALLGRDSGAEMVFLALATMPFLLFDLRERAALGASLLCSLGCFLLARSDLLVGLEQVTENYSHSKYQGYSAAVAWTVIVFCLFQISRANERAERMLRENREIYRLVTEAAGDAIVSFDAEGKVVFANPSAERIFASESGALVGAAFAQLTDFPTDATALLHEGNGRRTTGEVFHIEISVGAAQGPRGVRTAVIRDATERQRAAYSAKMAALGAMSGNIAHEVLNPLTALLLKAGRLRRLATAQRLDGPGVLTTVVQMEAMVQRIRTIVDALRSFSRDAGEDPLRSEPVAAIIGDAVRMCAQRFRWHSIELQVAPIDPALRVACRSVEVSQILLNLLGNAHDAVEGRPSPWVRVEVEADEAEARIAVVDSGSGIPRALWGRIMEPFFTTKAVGKGSGLGLSVSKSLAESHGGRLTLDTDAPHTRFVLALARADLFSVAKGTAGGASAASAAAAASD